MSKKSTQGKGRQPSCDSHDPEERRLWRWGRKQVRQYHKGTLSRDKIQKLEEIPGWTWDLSRWESPQQ